MSHKIYMLVMQITGNIVKSHFQYGRPEKMQKNEKWEFPYILTITNKQNLHINIIVENYNEIC